MARRTVSSGTSASPDEGTHREALEGALLKELTPPDSFADRLGAVMREAVAAVERTARSLHFPPVRVLVAGSAARGTYLPGNFDIDLFVLFPPEVHREDLVEMGLRLGEAVLTNPQKKYAEHPYLRGTFGEFPCEVVPGYAVSDGAHPMTAVDRTPFHQEYLLQQHTLETRGQVRLLKQFLKGIRVYGAEVATEGFSGYLTELLVLRAGSFGKVLSEASRWTVPMRLAPPGSEPAAETTAALVLADPVDPHRNVAAAVSSRNLALFILASREYLLYPTRDFFFPKLPPSFSREGAREMLTRRGSTVAALRFPVPGLVPDVLVPQLRRSERSLSSRLAEGGFGVLGTSSAVKDDQAVILVECREATIGPVRVHVGPPIGVGNTHAFLERWGKTPVIVGPYVSEDGRLMVEVEEDDRGLLERVRRLLPHLAMGRDLRPVIEKEGQVVLLEEVFDDPPVAEALRGLWRKGLPWVQGSSRRAEVEEQRPETEP